MGAPFQDLLHCAGIKSVPTTAHNPQGNSIIEAVHKSMGQVLRTLVHVHNPQTSHQAKAVCDTALATSMHATHCASHQALQHLTPCSFAFCRDMFFDLPLLTDIIALQNNHQQLVDSRLFDENSSQIKHITKLAIPFLRKWCCLCPTSSSPPSLGHIQFFKFIPTGPSQFVFVIISQNGSTFDASSPTTLDPSNGKGE